MMPAIRLQFVSSFAGMKVATRSYAPLTKNDNEKTDKKNMSLHFGPANSYSPNLLLSMRMKETVEKARIIQTTMLATARYTAPNWVPGALSSHPPAI